MSVSETRVGTLVLLGAGASAEAGYPTAGGLKDTFVEKLRIASMDEEKLNDADITERADLIEEARISGEEIIKNSDGSIQITEKPKAGPNGKLTQGVRLLPPTKPRKLLLDWFEELWEHFRFAQAQGQKLGLPALNSNGTVSLHSPVILGPAAAIYPPYSQAKEEPIPSNFEPYLETFFEYFDLHWKILKAESDLFEETRQELQYQFRKLRGIAIESAYECLSPENKNNAEYLNPLFNLVGPDGDGFAISTLNFDLTIESLAEKASRQYFDGFSDFSLDGKWSPPEWNKLKQENLLDLANEISSRGKIFVGFESQSKKFNRLVKLHGSLNWYSFEEGSGDIGVRDDLRYNTAFGYFRFQIQSFFADQKRDMVGNHSGGRGEDIEAKFNAHPFSIKAGQVWLRPYLIYARALKTRPDRLSLSMLSEFNRLLSKCSNIFVIGYSWGDQHINDLVYEAIGDGASLVNLSFDANSDQFLALLRHKFATTYPSIRERVFVFGGGAKKALGENEIVLPNGESKKLDLVSNLNFGVPSELSLLNFDL